MVPGNVKACGRVRLYMADEWYCRRRDWEWSETLCVNNEVKGTWNHVEWCEPRVGEMATF